MRRLLQAVRDLPEVATATASFVSPYDSGGWSSGYSVDGRKYQYWINSVTDEFKDALGLEIVQGRWFSAEDDAATGFKPVVINETFARYTFGDEGALGRAIPQEKARDGQPRTERRVVGVVREFRQHGEYAAREHYLFERMRLTDPKQTLPRMLLIKVRPGTGAAFEERLMAGLQAVARDWSFKVEYLDELRAANHRERLAPVLAVGDGGRLPALDGGAGAHGRALAERHPAHEGDRLAPRQGRHRPAHPPPDPGRGGGDDVDGHGRWAS